MVGTCYFNCDVSFFDKLAQFFMIFIFYCIHTSSTSAVCACLVLIFFSKLSACSLFLSSSSSQNFLLARSPCPHLLPLFFLYVVMVQEAESLGLDSEARSLKNQLAHQQGELKARLEAASSEGDAEMLEVLLAQVSDLDAVHNMSNNA
jgi:hypothetical protein